MIGRLLTLALSVAGLFGCGPSYLANTDTGTAVQQANKVEQGIVVGARNVRFTASGAAAGGIAGSQASVGPLSAFTMFGGSLVGGIAGVMVEHATADTPAFEYIVRKQTGDLVSVTQKDRTKLALGQKVLVMTGAEARVVPDDTLPPEGSRVKSAKAAKGMDSSQVVTANPPAEATSADMPAAENLAKP